MTELTRNNTEIRRNTWGWLYLITLYPFVAAATGVIKYTVGFGYLLVLGPIYLVDRIFRTTGPGIFGGLVILCFWGAELVLGFLLWKEVEGAVWILVHAYRVEETSGLFELAMFHLENFVFLWILSCMLSGIFYMLDQVWIKTKRSL